MPGLQKPSVSPAFDPAPERETMRGKLALGLMVVLALEVGFAFAILVMHRDLFEHVRELLSMVFGATVTLVGTAIGFYFGEKSGQAKG
jgi:hypothetical protein